MFLKVLQHVLIWLAASSSIVVSMSWAHAFGFVASRRDRWPVAVLVAGGALVFSAALVQRAPSAIVALVAVAVALGILGAWLLATGTPVAGAVLVVVAAIYAAALGPACLDWLGWRRP